MPSALINVTNEGSGGEPFSPQSFDPEKLIAAYLLHRITKLSKESLGDLASLASDIASCNDKDDFLEIAETIREILFPEHILGIVTDGGLPPVESEKLNSWKSYVGWKIREFREAASLSQDELGTKAGLTQSHISRLENGEHSPSNKTLTRIADALGRNVREFDPHES